MYIIWDNGEGYSDNTIRFFDAGPLSVDEACEYVSLHAALSVWNPDAKVVGFCSELTLLGDDYKVRPLVWLTDNFNNPRGDPDKFRRIDELIEKLGGKKIKEKQP